MKQFVIARLSSTLWAKEDCRPWVVWLTDDGYNPSSRAKALKRAPTQRLAEALGKSEARRLGVEFVAKNPAGDARLRELERAAAAGDVDAEAALIRVRIRNSTLFEEQVQLLADLGDPAAIKAVGMTPTTLLLHEVPRLAAAGPMYGALVAYALAEMALEVAIETASQGFLHPEDHRVIDALHSLVPPIRDWIGGERSPRPDKHGRMGLGSILYWQQVRDRFGNLYVALLRGDMALAASAGSYLSWTFRYIVDQPDSREPGWPTWLSLAWQRAQRASRFSSREVNERILTVVKPWVWAKGPNTFEIPQRAFEFPKRNPHLALIGNPPPPWISISHSMAPGSLTIRAVDTRTSPPTLAGDLWVIFGPSAGPSWNKEWEWGSPPVKIARIKNILVRVAYQRTGVGTALYQRAAELVADQGLHLASDLHLSRMSSGFWRKQVRKGRARKVTKQTGYGSKRRLRRYVLDPALPRTLENPGFEEGKISKFRFGGGHFHVPRDAREHLDRLADDYRRLSAELDHRLAAGHEVGDLEEQVEALAELLETAAEDLETGETEMGRRREVMPGLEGQLADLYAEYLQGERSHRFRPYSGCGYTTRQGGLASTVRMVAWSKIIEHGAPAGWEISKVTDAQAVAAARDAYLRRERLRDRARGEKAPWSMSVEDMRAWVERRTR